MAEIRPFAGIRYDLSAVKDLATVITPPYDVISVADQVRYHIRSPHNAIRLELAQESLSDTAEDNRYTRAVEQFASWLRDGVLRQDSRPALYLHEQEFFGGRRLAIYAEVRLEDWHRGIIFPHQLTLAEPKEDRLALLRHAQLNTSPILAMYEDPRGQIQQILKRSMVQRPEVEFVDEAQERHRLWILDQPAWIREIQIVLRDQPLFVADGHHRYETALAYRNELRGGRPGFSDDHPANHVLMALVDLEDPGLVVFPTHRLIRANALPPGALTGFGDRLRAHFDIQELPLALPDDRDQQLDDVLAAIMGTAGAGRQEAPPRMAMVAPDASGLGVRGAPGPQEIRYHLLTLKDPARLERPGMASEAWQHLDVTVLHYLVLEQLLGLGEQAWRQGAIAYTRDPRVALDQVVAGRHAMAFLLNPPPVHAIKELALAGDKMPQKSTYFYPKLPTGLVFKRVQS